MRLNETKSCLGERITWLVKRAEECGRKIKDKAQVHVALSVSSLRDAEKKLVSGKRMRKCAMSLLHVRCYMGYHTEEVQPMAGQAFGETSRLGVERGALLHIDANRNNM